MFICIQVEQTYHVNEQMKKYPPVTCKIDNEVKANELDTLYKLVIDHIKSYEGFRSKPYRDTDGSLTIGYGHHFRKGENYSKIDSAFGEKLLIRDLNKCIQYVESTTDLRDNQSLAIGMLAYNCGTGKVNGYINRGLLNRIQDLPRYCHYSYKGKWIKSKRLEERRKFELKVYTYEL